MSDFDAARVLGKVIHDALNPKGNDFQAESRAVIAAIQADTQQGAQLRKAIIGFGPAPALWDRLDKTAAVSAQMIEWQAPRTAELIHSEHVAARAHRIAETARDPNEAALWLTIATEMDGWPNDPDATDGPGAISMTRLVTAEDVVTSTEQDAARYEARRGQADD